MKLQPTRIKLEDKRTQPDSLRPQRGQISVMIAVMMSTFILLFAFVINTGMLVNAKINLQNAADLAAYAGASVQARQLTHISYLNYEMRRQWKKLLFRLYVIGNMAQDSFPANGGSGPMEYKPNLSAAGGDYQVPSTCIIFNRQDNFCHLTSLPAISIPPASFFDSISDTLHTQLSAIEVVRQKNCQAIGQTNKFLNIYWLFNGDPTAASLEEGLQEDQKNVIRITRALLEGVGVVPAEIILEFRIKTLKDYINQDPQKALNLQAANGLQGSQDPAAFERSIQAFFSAYFTLGNHIFSDGSIEMDELVPKNLVELTPITTKVDTVTIDLSLGDNIGAGVQASENAVACNAKRLLVSVKGEVPVGFSKDPSLLTYYAVRLRAKAKILFSPFGDMDLKAYAAAQPFGSRIGPANETFSFQTVVDDNPVTIPNLAVRAGDSSGQGSGWDTKDVVGTMFGPINTGASGTAGGASGGGLLVAYHQAMAPNPAEKGKYNIINDQTADHFVRNFDVQNHAAFWAPVVAPGKESSVITTIQERLKLLFQQDFTGNVGFGNTAQESLKNAVTSSLSSYISALQSGGGVNGENLYVAVLENPIEKNGVVIPGSDLFMVDPKNLQTSWNDVNDANFYETGRNGYSVKMVAFQTLDKKKLPAGGSGSTWTNSLSPDGDLEADVQFIMH